MANHIEVQIPFNSADKFADERRSRLGGEFADWDPYRTGPRSPVTAEYKIGGYQHDIGGSGAGDGYGKMHSKGEAYAKPSLRPGHVIIDGIETTIESAKNAGYAVGEGEQRRPFADDSRPAVRAGNEPRGKEGRTVTPVNPAQKPDSAPQESTGKQEGDTAGQSSQEIAAAASEAIQGLERTHGAHVVDAGIMEMTQSGYLPDEDELPSGVTMAAVEKIVAGYTAQANDALANVGASVDMLMETLSEDNLREARSATIMNDRAKLEHLGREAKNRLALLPDIDPEGFAEMVEGMTPAERQAISQNARGDWVVTVPGRKPMGFATAVREGIVRV